MSASFESSQYFEFVGKLAGHKARVSAMAWSPNGDWLASCSLDGVLNLWSSSLRTKNRPRFSRHRHSSASPALTCLAWSADGGYLAAGSAAGWLDIWQADEFVAVDHSDAGSRSTIRSVAWAPERDPGELRLAFAGDDRIVHFRNYSHWDRPDTEKGLGHQGAILSLAWSPGGDTIVTGTDAGTIGIWEPSQHDNQLRDVLDWSGIRAHDGPVTSLAWSAATAMLASGSRDGRLHLWNVKDRVLVDRLAFDEDVLDVRFALDGTVLVVHTRDRIRFVRCRPFREIRSYDLPAVLDATRSWIAFDGSSLLAVVDSEDDASIAVWRVDIEAMLRQSAVTERAYRAVNVPLLGEAGSGRTNLALALTGRSFNPKQIQNEFCAHLLAVPAGDPASSADDICEIAFWDLPSSIDHSLVQQIHADGGAVALVVVDPLPGTEVTAPANLERWRHALRRWKDLPRRRKPFSLVVVTKCDSLSAPPGIDDSIAIAKALGVVVFFTSAKTGLGISELRTAILAAVDWAEALSFPSVETFGFIRTCAQGLRGEQRYLTSMRELYEAFRRAHRFLAELEPDESEFRKGVRLLEIIGEAEYFELRDEVLVAPSYYHAYAAAMIAGAQKDETGMGRLPLQEAEFGRGRHISLDESERLADPKQESKLLNLTIHELVHEKRVAQIVATDGVSHLVFPMSLMRIRDAADPRPPQATGWQFDGAADDIFSSLVVRLLGLKSHYPKSELWKNEARFVPSSGGYCGLAMTPKDSGDEAELSIYFDDQTGETEQAQFVDLVRGHLVARARSVRGETDQEFKPHQDLAKRRGQPHAEVYFSWQVDRADATTAQTVAAIAAELEARGIRVFGASAMRPGETHQDQLARLEKSRVAAFLVAGPLSKAQELDYSRLEPAGCRIIPVVLPNARKNFVLPPLLKRWGHIDFRGKFLDVTPLAHAIVTLKEAGPVARDTSAGHVFVSYCHDDFERVDQLRLALESAGHPIWWDRGHGRLLPGTDWDREIRQAIRTSYAFILCLSEYWMARTRSGVYPEVIEAITVQRSLHPTGVFIIPVRFSECEAPDIPIDALRNLAGLQRFDYYGLDAHVGGLVSALDKARKLAHGGALNASP